jgi:hypothetical protein
MPPTWKSDRQPLFTFVMFDGELTPAQLLEFLRVVEALGVPNPRPLTRHLIEVASLCHPLLFKRLARSEHAPPGLRAAKLLVRPEAALPPATHRYYMQSLLFLAGCTLTPAIVQGRFSTGTIDSKLLRLWQAAHYARRFDFQDLRELELERVVLESVSRGSTSMDSLIAIKRAYGQALRALSDGLAFEPLSLRASRLTAAQRRRFGFVGWLRERLGQNLECVIAYGSSVTSQAFADYDLLVVVADADAALRSLAGTRPRFGGKELNLGIYGADDFVSFQAMSGDNLDEAALCLYGAAEIPIKAVPDLTVRNLSFGFVRLRQIVGLAGFLAARPVRELDAADLSLYGYFVKIPVHVMKGMRSVRREPVTKDLLHAWAARDLGYDLDSQLELLSSGRLAEAMARACCATDRMLVHLNDRYGIFRLVPAAEGDCWSSIDHDGNAEDDARAQHAASGSGAAGRLRGVAERAARRTRIRRPDDLPGVL